MTTLEKYIHLVEVQHKADLCKGALLDSIYTAKPMGDEVEQVVDCTPLYRAVEAVSVYRVAKEQWMKVPKNKRVEAEKNYAQAMRYLDSIVRAARSFSGEVVWDVGFGDAPVAESVTSEGGRYSSRCRYRKTDVTHRVRITPKGYLSVAGLPTIPDVFPLEYTPKTKACTYAIVSRGKLVIKTGYLAHNSGAGCVDLRYETAAGRLSAMAGVEVVE